MVPAFPQYLSGFVHALEPVPGLAPFVVETMSTAFARLPDPVLLPWLPNLVTTLREHGPELVPLLVREAGRTFPGTLPALDAWVPPWVAPAPAPAPAPVPKAAGTAAGPEHTLLAGHPEPVDAVAALLGAEGGWHPLDSGTPDVAALLTAHPATAEAVASLLAHR